MQIGAVPASYTWEVNGNLQSRTGGPYGDATLTHDWRDKLTSVQQGNTTTDILLDPLGRMVGKIRHTPSGDLDRAYLHDGDQVVLEYVQQAGGTAWQPERRHTWARWIDDLAVEQVDADGDGTLETTLYPITDLLGSVQLLTDDAGTPVERITYDPDGTPDFWSADTNLPTVTRVAWTGDGALPTGDTVTPQAFEIGLSEPIDPASAANATATLTPDGGNAVALTLTLAADSRAAYLTGATIQAGTTYTLHLDGLTDTTHNPIWPEDQQLTVADPNAYEVLNDTTAPQLLAVLDGSDALYLLFDEPVEPQPGIDLTTAMGVSRPGGGGVTGAATRLTGRLFKWEPAGVGGLAGSYTVAPNNLHDLAGNLIPGSEGHTFTHPPVPPFNTTPDLLLLAYAAPNDTQPEAQSAYGLTTLFQGRTWHADLGMYYYRNRWYLPEMGEFAERDPLGYEDSSSAYQHLAYDPANNADPMGQETWAVYLDDEKMLTLVNVQNKRAGMVPADLPRLYPWGYPKDEQTRVYVRYSTFSGEIIGAASEVVEVVRDYRYRESNPPWVPQAKQTNILGWQPALDPWQAYERMDEGGRTINRIISGWLVANKRVANFRKSGPIGVPVDFLVGAGKIFSNVVTGWGLVAELPAAIRWAGRLTGWASNAHTWLSSDDFMVEVEDLGMPLNLGILPKQMPQFEGHSVWSQGRGLVASH